MATVSFGDNFGFSWSKASTAAVMRYVHGICPAQSVWQDRTTPFQQYLADIHGGWLLDDYPLDEMLEFSTYIDALSKDIPKALSYWNPEYIPVFEQKFVIFRKLLAQRIEELRAEADGTTAPHP